MQLENESMSNYPLCVISIPPLTFLPSQAGKKTPPKNKKSDTLLGPLFLILQSANKAALLAADV